MSKLKNEIGNTYGYLTVIERGKNTSDGHAKWICQCECGNIVEVLGKHLRSGNTKSCGCYQKERAIISNMKRGGGDLTGQRYGKLVVEKFDHWETTPSGKRDRMWLCKCDCGNTTIVNHRYLHDGSTNSCGCMRSLGEIKIDKYLKSKNILFKREFSFKDFKTKQNKNYRFDFAILNEDNSVKCLIEYQGDIHFIYRENGWNNKENFEKRQLRDYEKFEFCQKNNIKLYYITYKDNIIEKLEEILSEL